MRRKRTLCMLVSLCLIITLLGGCAGQTGAPGSEESAAPSGGEESYKVAMVLPGYKNDAGWNQSAYEGMEMAKEQYGVEIYLSEGVPQADYESTLRDYAAQGCDMVICVGNEFSDAALAVAPDFPDTIYAVMNGNSAQEPNVGAYRFNTPQTGFLAGVLAAEYSKNDMVGIIIGSTAPHLKDAADAFEAGAKYINPDIQVLYGCTETNTDVAKGKEMAMAFIEQGADVICASANSASLGAIEASKESGISHIGYIDDQNEVAPDTVKVSMVQSNQLMILSIIESGVKGEFTPELHLFGMEEGAVYISDYHGHDAELTEEQLAEIDAAVEGVRDGSLKEQGIIPKSSFED